MYLESKRHWVHSASVDVILILVVHEEQCVPGAARTTGGVAGTLVSIHQTRRHPHIQDTPLIQHLTEHHVCVDIDYKHHTYIEVHPKHRIECIRSMPKANMLSNSEGETVFYIFLLP